MVRSGSRDDGSKTSAQPDGWILLTGMTGFVGGALLRRLLDRDARRIVCLIRGEDDEQATKRGRDRLETLLGRPPVAAELARLEWLRGDCAEPGLGLLPLVRHRLTRHLEEIYHCAASVEFDLPLEAAHRINCGSVVELLSLARDASPRFERLHHVSTAYVSGHARGRVDAHHLPSDDAGNFRNTYERTKARAERLLRDQRDVPTTIYRPSIIAGDTRTGRTENWNVVYVPMRQIVRDRLPFLPKGGRAIVDTVGIDFVVDGLLALAAQPGPRFRAHHLTAGEKAFDVRTYLDVCNEAARERGRRGAARALPRGVWQIWSAAVQLLALAPRRLGKLRRLGEAARAGLRGFAPYLAYTSVDVVLDAEREHAVLARHGIAMPEAERYLRRIVEFALDHEFGRRPIPAEILAAPAPHVAKPDRALDTDREVA